jgi:hypothetical protein
MEQRGCGFRKRRKLPEALPRREIVHEPGCALGQNADDTPVPFLAPGNGKTKTGRFWVYLRDERPRAGAAPPAVLYRYTPDRKGEHCRAHLASFAGQLHADGYSGFGELYQDKDARPACVAEVACRVDGYSTTIWMRTARQSG